MRYSITIILTVLVNAYIFAQTQRMNHLETSRTFTVENKTTTIQPLLQEADRQLRTLDYEGTYFKLESAVAQEPASAEALMLRAKFKKMTGMDTEAKLDVQMAESINPYAPSIYGYEGNRALLNVLSVEPERYVQPLGKTKKLNDYYEALDRKIAADELKNYEIDYIEYALQNIETDNLDEALDALEIALQKFPYSAIAYDLKGLILQKQGNLEAAVAAFSKAVVFEPDFAIAWYNLGQTERSRGNYDKSKKCLDRAIELQSDLAKAYFERAILHKQIGEKEAALEDYNAVIDLQGSTYMEAFLNRGLTKKVLGDFTGALTDLNQVIDEFPDNADLRKNRGNLYLLFGMPQRAIEDYSKAIQLDGEYAEAYYNRAIAFLVMYDKVSACADLDRSIELGYDMAEEIKIYSCSHW